jgi:hypothetical protein
VAVHDDTGVVGAVNLSVYEGAVPVKTLIEDFYHLVGATAERISRILGYEPSENGDAGQ